MHPTQPLADALLQEQLRRAETMSPVERMLEGARMFDRERVAVAQSFRKRFPEATEQEIQNMVAEEYRARKEKEDAEIYFPVYFVDAAKPNSSP